MEAKSARWSGGVTRFNPKEWFMDSVVLKNLTGLLVPLFALMLPVIIVGIVLYARGASARQRNDIIGRLVEKGLPIPPELMQQDSLLPKGRPNSPLRTALTLLGLGIGLIIFFLAQGGDNWGIGAIPLAIGLAQLLAWKLEKPRDAGADGDTR
jgi:hypothetical protein